ncbi:hypothetical protein [Legionella maceachernii]|uniref:Uncharacterized protein n=1 Tax=Legionella maceachernii TaxID=466 RepID=A0A0W0WFI6_9GAMM|nr:hypothetical protein [Legionella maceachernii]KTD31096.1 hypothetical protein Lmac_0399 [Legionella maceachernii]SJZ98717.1 hypothetical protein SAMN02745128_01667 [Legionella maceachernii]SUP01178.1 Uncharacterised protein [Legionella maceachernii]
MKTKSVETAKNEHPKIDELIKDVRQLIQSEKEALIDSYFKKIIEKCSKESALDKDSLRQLFQTVHANLESDQDKKLVKETWNSNEISLDKKARKLAEFLAENEGIPSITFVRHMKKFLAIVNADEELDLLLNNPQDYIFSHPNFSAHDLQILEIIINDPKFNKLPSIHKEKPSSASVYTPLSSYMYQLRADTYGSMDALRFPHCINPTVKEQVIERSKKEYHGPKVMGGMGAQQSYDRNAIKETAAKVKKMKMGACHTFAQLGADHLLNLMEEGKLPPMPIKIVSHKQSLGSHTFLLLGHKSQDLTDLSHCLIVDPWAVAMGHDSTHGIFTEENYPYPGMTTQLECCYDSEAPVVSSKKESSANQSLSEELSSALARGGFFSASNRNQSEEKLTKPQRIAVEFLTDLMNYADKSLHHPIKKELVKTLIDSVKTGEEDPATAIQLATLAMHARAIEKDGERYKWKGITAINDESFINLFSKSAGIFWKNYVAQNIENADDVASFDASLVSKIVKTLDSEIAHEFKQENTLNSTI